jgi:hypothetical protein
MIAELVVWPAHRLTLVWMGHALPFPLSSVDTSGACVGPHARVVFVVGPLRVPPSGLPPMNRET